jgi:hypothetical protein
MRRVAMTMLVGAALSGVAVSTDAFLGAQSTGRSASPIWNLPSETTGVDNIARTLVSLFDQADILALGEMHRRQVDSDLRIAMVRDPDFAKKVRVIVVEFASTTEQPLLDGYIRGDAVSGAQLAQVWKTTTQAGNGVWDDPMYAEFFAAVRDVNTKLPADARIRVLGGDPGPGDSRSRESAAVAVLEEQVLQQHGKALVIYGAGHLYRTAGSGRDFHSVMGDVGLVRTLDADYPGRTLVVIPVGGPVALPRGVATSVSPDYQKFDRALKTDARPVLLPLGRLPFRDFTAEEFIGAAMLTCRGPAGCVSVFHGSDVTLGQTADACFYVGGG